MNKKGYSDLESVEEQNESTPRQESFSPLIRRNGALLVLAAIGITCLVTFTSSSFNEASKAEVVNDSLMSLDTIRDCTLEECYDAGCPKEAVPFLCKTNFGCSSIPWVAGTCAEQCSLKICDSLIIPDDTPSCDGVECSAQWCEGAQKCGTVAPYQCLSGSSRFGCSSDDLTWTLYSLDTVCSECCDVGTCVE